MRKRLSMDDIARDLNISKSTISFIINGKAKEMRISDTLANRVLDYVKEKNYNRNTLAQNLRTGKSNIICLIVEDIADAFFSGVARLIEERAYKKGYKIIYCSTEDDAEKTAELINMFKSRHVDGYIITAPKGIDNEVVSLLNEETPFVLFDRYLPEIDADYVGIDNYQGARIAIEHFAGQGFREIAFVTLDSDQTQMTERLHGYQSAISETSLPSYVLRIPFSLSPAQVVQSIKKFLRQNPSVDAILFATNYLALQGFEALNKLKLRIPDDVAVIGFDDHTFFKVFNPPVTAVAQPMKALSEKLISVLFKRMNDEDRKRTQNFREILKPELIIRESSIKISSNKPG
ncbi:substrate-binding domain-containing protein [Mucilaginibacter sp. JRF]|uniref:LacI family DNA-binding transcriptional regulator n=1 Tax=Mucilaginibacter sp. JRF TaxID=2780088 RepID=UPI00187FE5E4|nr:substrate-binding domain-containing protein [Mucilaginibacter sp. JRF]MBE9583375.1 substrate-binding domain-containing protein [Mucilaginibacter sp. JRF]